MSAIFLSHSSADDKVVDDIRRCLESLGHRSLFLDFDPGHGIAPGARWRPELFRKLQQCRAVILVCSQAAMRSPWVIAEVAVARWLGKVVIPVRLDDCDVPGFLEDSQWIDMEADFDSVCRALARGLVEAGLDPDDSFDWDSSRAPYPGFAPFEPADAAVFFGREPAIRDWMDRLERMRLDRSPQMAVVTGASGCGKSSFVRAGLLPRLRRNAERWLVVGPFRPGDHPLDALAESLGFGLNEVGRERSYPDLRAAIESPTGLQEVCRELRLAAGGQHATVLLVIDQLEESDELQAGSSGRGFLSQLDEWLSDGGAHLLCLATLRSDRSDELDVATKNWRARIQTTRLRPISNAELAGIIEQPARRAGIELEPGLVSRIVEDVRDRDALPLLAFALRRLYELGRPDARMTLAAYEGNIGGIEGSVDREAEAVVARLGLDGEASTALRATLVRLVRIDDEAGLSRQPLRLDSVTESAREAVEALVDARLLVSDDPGDGRVIEASHEALFREWGRLRRWLEEDRALLEWRRELARWIEPWRRDPRNAESLLRGPVLSESRGWLEEHGSGLGPEELEYVSASVRHADRRARRSRRLRMVIGTIIVAFAVIAAVQWRLAAAQRDMAVAQQLAAQSRVILDNQPGQMTRAALLAVESLRRHPTPTANSVARDVLEISLPSRLAMHGSGVWHYVLFSPTGTHLARRSCSPICNRLFVYDAESGEELWRGGVGGRIKGVEFLDGAAVDIQFSPDGTRLVGVDSWGRGQVREVSTGAVVSVFEHRRRGQHHAGKQYASVAYGAQGLVATAGFDNLARVYAAETGDGVSRIRRNSDVLAVTFHPESDILAVVEDVGPITLVDARSGTTLNEFERIELTTRVEFSPDGSFLAAWGEGPGVHIWHIDSGEELALSHSSRVNDVAFAPDGASIATGTGHHRSTTENAVRIWGLPSGELLLEAAMGGMVNQVEFVGTGDLLAAASDDGSVRLWDTRTGAETSRVDHGNEVTSVAADHEGRYLATGSGQYNDDGPSQFVVWAIERGSVPVRLVHPSPVQSLAWGPNANHLATTSGRNDVDDDWTAHLWDLESGREEFRVPQSKHCTGVATGSSGSWLATSRRGFLDVDEQIEYEALDVWDAGDPPMRVELAMAEGHTMFEGPALRVSEDGGQLHGLLPGGAHYAWDTDRWAVLRDQQVQVAPRDPTFSRQCDYAAGSYDGNAAVVSLQNGQLTGQAMLPNNEYPREVAISSDGSLLATARENVTHVWNRRLLELTEPSSPLPRFFWFWNLWVTKNNAILHGEDTVQSLAFSPDDRYLAVAAGALLSIWDLDRNEVVFEQSSDTAINDVAFGADSNTIAYGSDDGTVTILDGWTPRQLIEEMCTRLSRNLSEHEWNQYLGSEAYRATCPGLAVPDA